MIKIKEISKTLKKNKSFQYWNKEIGLSFEDFDLIDMDKDEIISHGKKDIGNYTLFLKNGKIESAFFDLDNESVRNIKIKKVA
ncbi:MAG: hypothetical protein C0625_01815 [Arcobacter sp.]|nr:MAG: hypothetical protein C0625_01815 [Arcobacter sp.]